MQRQDIFCIENAHNSIPEIEVAEVHHFKNSFEKFFYILKKSIVEYCSVSSIVGFVHLISLGVLHRVFWFILLILSVIGCYFTIVSLLGAREVLIVHEDNTISTSEIPFPAVTVCTTAKADHRKYNNYNNIDSQLNSSMLSIEYQLLHRILFKNIISTHLPSGIGTSPRPIKLQNIEKLIYELGIKEKDLITSCSINNRTCSWSKVLTPDGLCYTFNLIDPEEMFQQNIYEQYLVKGIRTKGWSYKHGYENNFETDVYPLRGLAANKDNELKIRLQMNLHDLVNSKEEWFGKDKAHGFFIYVGHPIEYPYQTENRVFVPLNVHYRLDISPDMILADEKLKNYPVNARNCFLDKTEWKHMKTFKEYSLSNCLLECTAQISSNFCNCIQFFVPSSSNNTCGSDSKEAPYCYHDGVPSTVFEEISALTKPEHFKTKCNCFPPCASLTYNVQETMIGTIPETNNTHNFSDITVKFRSSEFVPKHRQESYSNLDLLSAIGGNLGLFVGASVTSIVELVYYCTIKLFLNLYSG